MDPPENPVELPGVAPPDNKVDDDVVPLLLTSDYNSYDESDDEYEDTNTSAQQHQRVIHPEAMPPTGRNLYNLCPRKKNDYVKEKID